MGCAEYRRWLRLSDRFRIFEVPSPIYSRVEPLQASAGLAPGRGGHADERIKMAENTNMQTFRRAADQFTQVLGLAGPQAEELAKKSSQNIEALSQASNILVKGAQEFSREWFELVQDHMSKNIDAMNRLASCHSLQDFVSVQGDIARDRLGHAVESSRRLATVWLRVADEAARVIQSQAGRNAGDMEKTLRRVS
jgi:phasin family protein